MKQFKRELAAAGLLYFKEGVPKSLNPDLGIDEQAELLPYDDKFEFPAEKLQIGQFHLVYLYLQTLRALGSLAAQTGCGSQ